MRYQVKSLLLILGSEYITKFENQTLFDAINRSINLWESGGRAFGTAPIAKINWEADDSDNKCSFPVGAGVADTFFLGKTPSRVLLEGQYYPIHQDDFGPRWNIRLAWAVFLPSLAGK